ncbi:hypothetical protein [Ochrobactrum sp. Marseille-Q0166]|uniref:hypothetical protein n=1 Tax=Ochrobactrum sp. Marseille-Q0166 TaxID=2761105 RepID=UPI001654F329|nr:hypothetical protein [Ochrobactrum sp. Marseille-Q0166]MBC8718410.1 hypothetical protein [Ochrobactrum sp. Marseille-Q0166]
MPFRTGQLVGTYKPEQLRALQRAYVETCVLLNVSLPTAAEALKIAKQVYKIYDSGIEDPYEIARIIRHANNID